MDGLSLLQRSEQGLTQTLAVKSFDYSAVLGKDVDGSGRDWIVRNRLRWRLSYFFFIFILVFPIAGRNVFLIRERVIPTESHFRVGSSGQQLAHQIRQWAIKNVDV